MGYKQINECNLNRKGIRPPISFSPLSAKAEAAILVCNREASCSEWQSNPIYSWVFHTTGPLVQLGKAQTHAGRAARNNSFNSLIFLSLLYNNKTSPLANRKC